MGTWKVGITWSRVLHSGFTIGYRFDFLRANEKLTLVYSPDTSFLSKLAIQLARNADYWILDSTFPKAMLEQFYRAKKPHTYLLVHSSPARSAQMCTAAHVGTYIVGHYFWKRYPSPVGDHILREIADECKIPAIISWDLLPIRLQQRKKL
jgi:ribonuclease BN (tRNA processing enzyme)